MQRDSHRASVLSQAHGDLPYWLSKGAGWHLHAALVYVASCPKPLGKNILIGEGETVVPPCSQLPFLPLGIRPMLTPSGFTQDCA